MSSVSAKQELLYPGSVWERSKNGDTTQCTVLFVSNEGLSESVQAAFPQQVVFLTHKRKVLTQTIDTFLNRREYVGTDEHVVRAVSSILEEEEVDLIDDDQIDNVKVEDEDEDEGSGEDAKESEDDIPVFYPPTFNGVDLNAAFISYSEGPNFADPGNTLHQLRFQLSDECTAQQLSDLFDQRNPNALGSIVVDAYDARIEFDITSSWPIFYEVDMTGRAVALVFVNSEGYLHDDLVRDASVWSTPIPDSQPVVQGVSNPLQAQVGNPTQIIQQIQPQAVQSASLMGVSTNEPQTGPVTPLPVQVNPVQG